MPLHEPLWTIDDVAAFLVLSPRTVRKHQMAGNIPSIKVMGSVRFVPDEIRAWLERQRAVVA